VLQWYNDWSLLDNKEASEMYARVYDELMVRIWMEDDWDWETLNDYKHSCDSVPEVFAVLRSEK
jgi:hypothetical protein